MNAGWNDAGSLLTGPLRDGAPWPLTLTAVLCDLRPRFLPKGTVGGGCRAVARNGRVLLCGDRPLAELVGKTARVRIQTWNRRVLPGEAPAPHGVLLCIRCADADQPAFSTRLTEAVGDADLALDVGGLQVLAFFRLEASWKSTSTATSARAARSTPS